MPKYDLVIFDVDGTLLDTTEGIEASVRYTIARSGLPELSSEQIRGFIGPPIQNSFAAAYGIEDKNKLQVLAGIFRDRYKEHELLKARPYEGIYEICHTLKEAGVHMAVATYKREDYALILMKHFGFDRYMDAIYGGDHENRLKKKDIIMKCLVAGGRKRGRNESGVQELRIGAVMIGDTMHDALGAKEIGVDFIGVTYGFGFRQKSEIGGLHCVGAVEKPLELAELIL